MIDRMGRRRALLGLTAIAIGAMTILAPAAAFAQDLGGTSVPDLNDTVGSTTGAVDSTTDTVDSTTGAVGSTTGAVTKPVKDTVDSTSGTVDATGGTVTQPVKDTVDKVDDVAPVSDTTKTIEDTTKATTDSVSGTVSGTKDTTDSLGGTIMNPDLTIKSPLGKLADSDGDGKLSKKERIAAAQQTTAKMKAALAAERSQKMAAKDALLARLERNHRTEGSQVADFAPPPRESFLTQLADAAVEATKKLVFPLGLALMVGAFLIVQGRIDRKDAKLALAPIDPEQDLLSFQ